MAAHAWHGLATTTTTNMIINNIDATVLQQEMQKKKGIERAVIGFTYSPYAKIFLLATTSRLFKCSSTINTSTDRQVDRWIDLPFFFFGGFGAGLVPLRSEETFDGLCHISEEVYRESNDR